MTANVQAPTPPPIVAQYEALRAAALGAPLPPEARIGLALFVRRGMWGWCRALTTGDAPPAPSAPHAPAPDAPRAVIQILADLVLNALHGRAP